MRGNLSTSLLEGFTCSDAAQSDCENRTVVWKLLEKRHAGSWLSRLPLTKNWKIAGTFSQEHCSVFVGRWLQCSPAAPCWIGKSSSWLKKRVSRNETAKPSLRSFTSFQMIHTHTLLHTDAFAHRRYYTQTLLPTDAFTHRRFYTQTLLHTSAFTRTNVALCSGTRFETWPAAAW